MAARAPLLATPPVTALIITLMMFICLSFESCPREPAFAPTNLPAELGHSPVYCVKFGRSLRRKWLGRVKIAKLVQPLELGVGICPDTRDEISRLTTAGAAYYTV